MDRTVVVALAAAALAGGSMWAWSARATKGVVHDAAQSDEPEATVTREPILPILQPAAGNPAKVALGKRLFNERALSEDGTVACSDCHDLAKGGADGRAVPAGVHGRTGTVNTLTVWNADGNAKQFWDGRADTLEAQVDGMLTSPNEMGSAWPATIGRLLENPDYVAAFGGAASISPATVREAIAAYERTLVTPGSPFDRWLLGDGNAIGPHVREGYATFKRYGCISCHQGKNVGGNLFETLGIMRDYFADRGGPITDADLGRFNVTQRPEDRYRFRVPSLRLVTKTAPYFHDGRVTDLDSAIVMMGKYQLGTEIPPRDVAAIKAFLAALGPQ